jgi:uncharacterized glyoxalase superfamily protein PhnB
MTENTTLTTPPKTAPVKCGLVAYLQLDGASRAAEFYREAFGAEVAAAHPPDAKGRTMHIHLYLNGASLMLSDFYPEHGQAPTKPQGFTLTLMVSDIQSAWDRAMAAGAEPVMPPTDMFWGDRYGALRDPFGVSWAMNQGMT